MTRRNSATSVAASLDDHLKDCTEFRRELRRQRALDRKHQNAQHNANAACAATSSAKCDDIKVALETLTGNVGNLHTNVTALWNKDAEGRARKQKWFIRWQRVLIGMLFTGLAYAVWHIIETKGLTP